MCHRLNLTWPCVAASCFRLTLSARVTCLTAGRSWSSWPEDSCSLVALHSSGSPTSGPLALIGKQTVHKEVSFTPRCVINNTQQSLQSYFCFVLHLVFRLSSLPAGCSVRLRAKIWRMWVEMGVDVTAESAPSHLSVRVVSPLELLELSKDSSNLCNHVSCTLTCKGKKSN